MTNNEGQTPLSLASEDIRKRLLDVSTKNETKKNSKATTHGHKSTKADSNPEPSKEIELEVQQHKSTINDYKVIGVLGEGSFGSVYLVERISQRNYYAMKVLSKANVISTKHIIQNIVLPGMPLLRKTS